MFNLQTKLSQLRQLLTQPVNHSLLVKELILLKENQPKETLNLKDFTDWLTIRNRSPQTVKVYSKALQQFKQPITTENIRSYLKANLKYQPNTLKITKQAFSSYAKFAKLEIEWDLIQGIIPKQQTKYFITINQAELTQLKAVKTERTQATHQRNNLILDFLFYSGLRVSELTKVKHSDYQNKLLKVHGKGNKIRFVFIPEFLEPYLKTNCSDYLFTNSKNKPFSDLLIRQIIQKRAKLSNLPKHLTPHSFRRSFATWLNNNRTSLTTIQKLLGHSQITTTADYIHNNYETLYADYSKWRTASYENQTN